MDSVAASRLADTLSAHHQSLCDQVSARLLAEYPEITKSLRLEENYTPVRRLSSVAVERLNELVRAILIFDLPSLADQELEWAQGVLPRSGVKLEHQMSMVRWFFEEVRKLPIGSMEQAIAHEIERYFLGRIKQIHKLHAL
ncbi:hypothetical protein OSCT_2171 [Oscillochloris trichoides DG-6]|uniref:Uncharacterized protein n=1 Tax=Oscillochloris trichoides DG-6 TaxID=765420 RepID=E1IFS0_9CHLR|nr:hypothetical protein [Oscillochloris trichoides]EFO79961.1 hypothetical protein OSCT_2171 [Oscillochloris trichoides DG-6]